MSDKKTRLEEKISRIKPSSIIKFINYNEGLEGEFTVNMVTEKAIKINNEWYPKSQIVDFDSITKKVLFNAWFAKKKTEDAWRNRTSPGAY